MAKQKQRDPVEMPDEIRRRDQPEPVAPDLIPRPDENVNASGQVETEDGGIAEHPIHDEDLEDLDSEDYEAMADEAKLAGFEPTEEEEDETR